MIIPAIINFVIAERRVHRTQQSSALREILLCYNKKHIQCILHTLFYQIDVFFWQTLQFIEWLYFIFRNNKIFVILLFILVHFYLFAISFHDLRLWFNFPQYQPCNKIVLIDYCLTCINCDEDKLLGKLGQKGGECQQSDQSYSEAAFFVCSQMGRRRQWCWSSLVEMGKSCFGRIQDWSGLFPYLSLLLLLMIKNGIFKERETFHLTLQLLLGSTQ